MATKRSREDYERIDGSIARRSIFRRICARRAKKDAAEAARDRQMRGLLLSWYAGALERNDPAELAEVMEALRLNREDMREDAVENADHDALAKVNEMDNAELAHLVAA